MQFKNFEEARKALSQIPSAEGVIIATIPDGVNSFIDFVQMIRLEHPKLGVIATCESMPFDDMRTLIGAGIDQILIRPFNANQLKDKVEAAVKFRQQVLTESQQISPRDVFRGEIERITDKYYKTILHGWITENCKLPETQPAAKDATMFIDLNLVPGINSIGIRSWLLWLKSLQTKGFSRFEFENIHPPLLNNASMVQGFIPPHGNVNSFYLFYWCEDLSIEKEFKFSRGKDFATDLMKIPRFRDEVIDGKPARFEIDYKVDRVLKFYTGKIDYV